MRRSFRTLYLSSEDSMKSGAAWSSSNVVRCLREVSGEVCPFPNLRWERLEETLETDLRASRKRATATEFCVLLIFLDTILRRLEPASANSGLVDFTCMLDDQTLRAELDKDFGPIVGRIIYRRRVALFEQQMREDSLSWKSLLAAINS